MKKRTIISVLVLAILLAPMVTFAAFFWNGDSFDYSDESSYQLKINQNDWQFATLKSPLKVNILQGEAVIYWHKQSQVVWKCKNSNSEIINNELHTKHNECLVYLPLQQTSIAVAQGQVVLVRPQADVSAIVYQGKLRMAENGEKYVYKINGNKKHSKLISNENATYTINIDSRDGGIEKYKYKK